VAVAEDLAVAAVAIARRQEVEGASSVAEDEEQVVGPELFATIQRWLVPVQLATLPSLAQPGKLLAPQVVEVEVVGDPNQRGPAVALVQSASSAAAWGVGELER
jgi:hypothetical protein